MTIPKGERLHIGLFGRTNAGKSSLINALTAQNLALVSEHKGTTTDPVYKAMELLPLGPVVLVDTPGLDDQSELGLLRVQKAKEVLAKVDIAILVVDSTDEAPPLDISWVTVPLVKVWHKCDLSPVPVPAGYLPVSSMTGVGLELLKETLGRFAPEAGNARIAGDLLAPGDLVILVTPIDASAPKGRLILPQQQTIRDILEADAMALVVKETTLAEALKTAAPKLVITDSQAFQVVAPLVPRHIPLTSFSILFARYKGDLRQLVAGAIALDTLQDGDKVLIAEGCTHHKQSDDIGTVKLPRMIAKYTNCQLTFDHTNGFTYPENVGEYALVIHCGACMLTRRDMGVRMAATGAVPITNYGVAMAHMQGILPRCIEMFPL